MKKKILASFASFLCVLAATTMSTASLFVVLHHPKVPKSLTKS